MVHPEKVEVLISKRRLREALIQNLPPGSAVDPSIAETEGCDLVHLSVDARLRHCGGEVRFVAPPRSTGDMPTRQVPSLLKAVVRGHDWRTQIIILRHSVWSAEKTSCIPLRIARKRRSSAIFPSKPDLRKCPTEPDTQGLWLFSLAGRNAVRFRRVRLANAMRSQTGHSAKAP